MSIVKIRQSQIVSTYGPGALVDLPDRAVLVAGLNHWKGESRLVPEPRLVANLRHRLRLGLLELRSPPVPERDDDTNVGIVGWQFPEWFVAQYEVMTKEFGRSRALVHRRKLVKGRFRVDDPSGKGPRKPSPVVPVRFVQACPNGHVSDIDWPRLVHGGASCGGQLWLDERGTTGDLSELFLRCDCGSNRISLMSLQSKKEARLGECRGERPWLGPNARELCCGADGLPHRNRLLVRHASNTYFPVIERAISIPDHDEAVRKAVDSLWDDFLRYVESPGDIARERKKQRVQKALEGLTDEEVWAECQRRQSGEDSSARGLKDVELDTFLSVPDQLGEDKPDGNFYARRTSLESHRRGAMAFVESVVLVHRLREVVAQIGFTRLELPVLPVDSEIDLGVQLAPLGLDTNWCPAVENRGEGVFIALDPKRVQKWAAREAVKERAQAFQRGFEGASHDTISGVRLEQIFMPYIMLHSLSHLLLTAISLECGYSAASIRERIYVREGAYGLLLYTGTPDAEGTLGGIVEVGRRIGRHLESALEIGRLCSNDPVCAQHEPNRMFEEDRLTHGAACHGCLLIAEPSCERRNEMLDRSLVVPTVSRSDLAFFAKDL